MDFSEDNGYKYVLDELKAIRAQVDKTINLLEKRMEKDKIINEVLSTEYDNEEDIEDDDIDFYEILEAYNKALDTIKQDNIDKHHKKNPFFFTFSSVLLPLKINIFKGSSIN